MQTSTNDRQWRESCRLFYHPYLNNLPSRQRPLTLLWLGLFFLMGTSARADFGAWSMKFQVGSTTKTHNSWEGANSLHATQTLDMGVFPTTADLTMPYLEVWTAQNANGGYTGALVTTATRFNYRIYVAGTDPAAATSFTATMVMNSSSGQDRRSQFLPSPALNLIAATGRVAGNYVMEYWITGEFDKTIGATTTRENWRVPSNTALVHKITFAIGTPAPAPTFAPAPGVYDNSATVTMSTTLASATIRYTTNGTNPTATSPAYTEPLSLTSNTTLRAGVFAPGYVTTNFTTGTYTILTATTVRPPVVTPNGGNVAVYQVVSLSTATEGATLRYTTNGSDPTAASPAYTGSLTITASGTLKVKGFKDGWTDSPITSATFTRRDPGLWGAKFRPNGINVEWYYNNANQANADMTKAFTAAVVVANGTPVRFGAEGHGSSDMPEAGFNDGKLNYRVYPTGTTPPSTFSAANLTLSNPNLLTGNRQLLLDHTTSGLTLQGMVGNQPGSYVLDAYYTYEIYDRQNGNGPMVPPSKLTARYPAANLFHRMTFDVKPVAPTFALATTEVYEDPVSVTITPGVAGAAIYYTIDGSNPTAASTPYTGPFSVSVTTTIKAVYLASGMPLSDVGTAVYTINPYNPNVYPKFVVSGKLILKKNSADDPGTPFQIKGTNFNGTNWNWDFSNDVNDASMPGKVADVWGFNTIRINCFINSHQSYKRKWNATDDQKLKTLIDRMTAKGVVCMIEVHDNTGWYPSASTDPSNPANVPCTQAELNAWWVKKAREYRNNPYVWFNIQNEPGFVDGTDYTGNSQRSRWRDMHQQAIQAIRGTQAENVIVVDAVSFASEAVGYATVIDDEKHRSPAINPNMSSVMQDGAAIQSYDPKNNVVFAVHPYTGWDSPGKIKNYLDMVAGAGFPVIVGEAGSVFRQTGSWKVGWGSRALWDILKYYRNGGFANSAGWMIWHWNGSGEQKFSYGGGCAEINSNNANTRPTNLNREGAWVWDQLHNPGSLPNFITIPGSGTTRIQVEQAQQWMGNYEQARNAGFAELTTEQVRAANGAEDRFTGGTGAKEWTEWDINVESAGIYKLGLYGYNKGGVDATFQFRSYTGALLGQVVIPANTSTPRAFNSNALTLPAGEQIFRVVRVEAIDANYSYFDIAQGAPDTAPPTTPGNVREFTRTATTTIIRWDASTDNEGIGSYEVFRNGTSLGKTGRTHFTDTGLQANTAYTYTVKAYDYSNNASEQSNQLALTTDPVQQLTNIDDKTEGTDFDQVSYSAKDPNAAGTNGWVRNNDAANFGGSEMYTAQVNATITIKFTGLQAIIYGTKKSGHGDMRVSIDGGPEYDIPASFYTAGADARRQFIFATPKLSSGPHTIVLRNLGSYVAFDYLEVATGALDNAPPSVPADLRVFYKTEKKVMLQWNASTDNTSVKEYELFKGGVSLGKTTKLYADYTWAGASGEAADFTVKASDIAGNVSDASAALNVTQPAAPTEPLDVDDKAEGNRLYQVQYSAKDPNPTATNGFVRYDDPANFGGSETYTTQNNATITIHFNGTQARVFGTKKTGHGEMTATIDGGAPYAVPVNFKTAGADERGVFIWATPDLPAGEHTLVLKNNGQYVAFDRLVIAGALDMTPPVAKAKNVTIQLNAQGQASITADLIDDGSTDNKAVTGKSLSKTSFDCSNKGDNVVTLTVTDAAGNSATATATVTVEDKIAPGAIAKAITVQLNAQGQATIAAADVNNGSTDNCDSVTLSLSKTSFDCSNKGANQVTLTVTDASGNTATTTATVTVEDKIAPTAKAKSLTVQLNAQGQATVSASDLNDGSSDNCPGELTYSLSKTTFDCSNKSNNAVVLTVTDASGNTATASATITVEDKVAPVAKAKNVSLQLNAQGQAALTTEQVNDGSNDNCGPVTLSLSKTTFDCSTVGDNQVILTVTDASGNTATATATVNVGPAAPAPSYASVGVDGVYPSGQANVTITQHSGNVTFAASNCTGTLTWTGPNGLNGTGNIVVPTNVTGVLTYKGRCTLNTCPSPETTVTVTVNAGPLKILAPVYNCSTRQLTIRTQGGNGNALEYHINSVTSGWEPIANISTLDSKHIGRELKVRARQRQSDGGGYTEVELTFTPTACGSGRVAISPELADLSVTVLGNPVIGQSAEVEVGGAVGTMLTLTLTDAQGRPVGGQRIEQPRAVERLRLPLGHLPSGILLLQVQTATQRKTVKVVKQ